ncbi:hypothetical protein FOA43_001040 [Brettanomyces nanus]|uniref:Exocyst complex component EXO84 n=1 Tax=Eeniella nana TaxID=13502 RepID=A0A875RTP7_EENNA|nr:uncharacterized protein FOA43_001040 [Brettanomyces nanus]QPG73727.1 hypothetical protein FOA43_001040 [Brettanomyces nanus]
MTDRRLSRANWSTKTKDSVHTNPPYRQFLSVPGQDVIEEEKEDEENVIEESYKPQPRPPKQHPPLETPPQKPQKLSSASRTRRVTISKPHRVDNSGHNRRFSVRIPRPDIAVLGNVPALPKEAATMVNKEQIVHLPQQSLKETLLSSSYDPTTYLHTHLQDADAEKIEVVTTQLADLSLSNNYDVKHTITQSLNSVLAVSDAVSATEEMLQGLKKTVSSLNDVMYQQLEDANANGEQYGQQLRQQQPESARSVPDKRRSVMILEKRWASNLNALFKEVDGAQQFVSAIPGRHVMAQSKRWGELNALTWKPIRPAHLIILNDYLLVATRKRIEDKKRTVATGCWPMREVTLVEPQNGNSSASGGDDQFTLAFKTRNASLLFQTDSQNEYNKVKVAFKKAKAECTRNSEMDGARNRSKNLRSSMSRLSSDHMNGNSEVLHDLSSQLAHRRARSRDSKQKSTTDRLNSIDENLTNVEICLGHQRFEESVDLINRLKELLGAMETRLREAYGSGLKVSQSDSQLSILIKLKQLKLQELTDELVKTLSWEICDFYSSNQDIVQILDLFRLLGLESKGRSVLLDAKTAQLEELVTSVRFEGDLKNYLLQASILYFNSIRQTYILYEQCFPQTKDKTFVIEWANERVSSYNKIFHRQLIDYQRGSEVYDSCERIAREQSQPLKQMGLNVDYLFGF